MGCLDTKWYRMAGDHRNMQTQLLVCQNDDAASITTVDDNDDAASITTVDDTNTIVAHSRTRRSTI